MIYPHPVPTRHGFSGGGRTPPPRNDLHPPPPEAFGTAPKSFCTPANYIYFDLIVSYLIILTTKFVKLPILRKSPNCGIASKIRISTTPTNVYDRAYIVLHVYNSNFEQPIRFLVTITIKRRLAV